MFKLIKVLNSASVAEPVRIPKMPAHRYSAGELISLEEGVATNATSSRYPEFVSLADTVTNAKSMLCIKITPGMLFECELPDEYTYEVGIRAILKNSKSLGVTSYTRGYFQVLDINGKTATVMLVRDELAPEEVTD